MSTAPSIQIAEVNSARSEPSSRSTFLWLHKHSWGLFDQVLISGTNFVTMVLAARAMHPDSSAFGEFSLVYSALLFTNVFQSTLVTQPHNVLASTRKGEAYRRHTTATGAGQLAMVVMQALLALSIALFAFLRGWGVAPLLLALVPTIIAWQLQEFVRRVLYTEGRMGAAFINDLISYGGQALVVLYLYANWHLTGPMAFYAITITSLLGTGFGVWQLRHSWTRHLDLFVLSENWHFGKWLAGAELLGWCSSLHMYLYIAAIILGTQASGELKSAQILYGPARVFAFFLGSVLPIRFAKSHHAGGEALLHQQFKSTAKLILPVLAAYCLFVAVFGQPLLRVLYGHAFQGSALLLALYSISALFNYVEMFVAAALTATKRTKYIFRGYVYGGIIAFCVSWPIIKWLGVDGAILCMILTAIIVNGMCWLVYHREIVVGRGVAAEEEESAIDEWQGLEKVEPDPIPGSGEILTSVLKVLDWKQVPYCLLHGYRDYPDRITSDVDCLVPGWAARGGLPPLLHAYRNHVGAQVVQYLADESPMMVLSKKGDDGRANWLPLHLTSGFKFNHLLFYSSKEIFDSRRRHNEFWVPAWKHEFGCVLINRVVKRNLRRKHECDLAELYSQDRDGCRGEIRRFWGESDAKDIVRCVEERDWDGLRALFPRLRAELMMRRFIRQPVSAAYSLVMNVMRRASRFLRPSFGLHVVFLGPDGVGKSTVIEVVSKEIAPAFMGLGYQTFAPSILPRKFQPDKKLPHELPPRSLPGSLLKACWWLVCYTVGYLFTVHTVRGRAGIVLCHRYLMDAIVDPKRYRYSGPIWVLKAIRFVAPKPDLVILLDAPAEVIQKRKQEVPLEETARQREDFRAVIRGQRNAHIVDASQPLAKTVADVNEIIVAHLRRRLSRRFGLGGRS